MGVGQGSGQVAGDDGVGDQGKVGAVLFEAAHGQQRHPGGPFSFLDAGGQGQQGQGEVVVHGAQYPHSGRERPSAAEGGLDLVHDLLDHFQQITWDEIYAGWASTEHQWYWRDLDYEVVPFETIPIVDGDGDGEKATFDQQDLATIVKYHTRVDARYDRRMAALDEVSGGRSGPPRSS